MWKRKGRIHLCSMILLALLWSGYTFAKPKQESLDQMRERSGQALQQSARGSGGGELLQHEKQLLTCIKSAGKSRDWFAAESCFKTYAGHAAPVFAATLHAAFLCGEYQEGALIYGKCKQRCSNIHPPVYAASLRIFAKLQDFEQVRAIWAEAMETCDLSEPLALARIAAAAEEGNVSEAAQVLDLLNNTAWLRVNVQHVSSAIRSCWGWGKTEHRAAKYFYKLLPVFEIIPNIIVFTALIGAYKAAPLNEIISAYQEMKDLKILPNIVFAETFITSVLQMKKSSGWMDQTTLEKVLAHTPSERLMAAQDALTDFQNGGVKVTKLCRDVKLTLHRLGFDS